MRTYSVPFLMLLVLIHLSAQSAHAAPEMHRGTQLEGSDAVARISMKDVWKPKGDATETWRNIHMSCYKMASPTDCITQKMKESGASREAIAYTKMMKGEVYLSSFEEMGKVDLAVETSPLMNSADVDNYVMVNGTPKIVRVLDQINDIRIETDPGYPQIARAYPKAMLWPAHTFKGMQKTAGGGQSFLFEFTLLNGCHACEVAGAAQLAFEFNKAGVFEGARVIRLIGK